MSVRLGDLASRIVIDHRKFTEYVLNPDHPDGKSKASGFQRMLGYTIQNYQELVAQLEVLVPQAEATPAGRDRYGQRYTVDIPVTGVEGQQATVRTGWIVEWDSDEVRLITLYVIGREK